MLENLSRQVKEELLDALISEMEDQDMNGMAPMMEETQGGEVGDGMGPVAVVEEKQVMPADEAMDVVKEKMDNAMAKKGNRFYMDPARQNQLDQVEGMKDPNEGDEDNEFVRRMRRRMG